jgi:hypothetical protein
MDIITDDTLIDEIFTKIKDNVKFLLDKDYSEQTLIQNAFSRGMNIVRGNIDKQTIVDLSVIALTILIQKEKQNDNYNRT